MQPPIEEGKIDTLLSNLPPKKKRRTQPPVMDEKGYRLKSGTFPIRFHSDGSYVEVLLVLSKTTPDRWTVIRGNIDPGEIAAEAAMRETREKSGVVGRLREPERPLGVWTNQEKRTKTSIFILDITQELDKWEEEDRMRKWFSLEEAEEALRAKPVHAKMFENLKDRLAVLAQEQKEAAERRKATAPPEEEARSEPEDTFAVLQTNGILDNRSSISLPSHHHIAASPQLAAHAPSPHAPLPTHPHQHPLTHHQHPQHSPLSQHQTHQPHQQHQSHQQLSQHPHQMQHPHSIQHAHPHAVHHLQQGVLVGLPEMSHVSSDALDAESHSAHTSHTHPSHTGLTAQHQHHQPHPSHQSLPAHQPHPSHSPHSSHPSPVYGSVPSHLNISAGSKRKLDELTKDPTIEGIPAPAIGHAPAQQ